MHRSLQRQPLRSAIITFFLVIGGVSAPLQAQQGYDFINWESPHVYPIDITPDMSRLLAVNTADHRLEVYDVASGLPEHEISIPVGLDPVTVRARTATEAWVVNHVSDSISVVDLSNGLVIRTLQTEDEPADVVFANGRAYVSCSQANSLMVFNLANLNAAPEIIPLHGEDPRALAVSPNENRVYVAFFESGNGSTIIRGGRPQNGSPYANALGVDSIQSPYNGQNPPPNSGNGFSPAQNPDNPPPPPVGMIVKKDNAGRWMDDNNGDWTNLVSGDNAGLSARVPGWDLPDNDIAIINTNNRQLVGYQSGLMNMVTGIDFNATTGRLAAVGTEAHNEIRYEPNLRSHFVTMRYTDLVPEQNQPRRVTDLNSHLNPNIETLALAQRANSIGDPRSITWGPRGNFGWVTGMGSNNIMLVDSAGQRRNTPVEVGQGPTGLVFNEDPELGYVFYVLNRFDATISVMQGRNTLRTEPFFDPTPEYIVEGRPLLYDTHEGSGLGQASCASCHVDARADRLAWDLGDPSADLSELNGQLFHPMKGPLRTTSLIGIVGSPSLHFRGDKRDLSEFAGTFEALQGLDNPASATDMDRLEAFLGGIHTPPNPYRNLDNSMPNALAIPGSDLRVGNPNVNNNCANCHGGPNARDGVYRNNSGNMPGGAFSDFQPAIAPSLVSMHEIFGLDYDDPDGSTAGFGFIPDGSNDLEAGNTLLNNNSVAFMMAFNGDREFDTHAAVGTQVTFNGQQTNAEEQLLDELIALADQGAIGLIAHGTTSQAGGVRRGWVYRPASGRFQASAARVRLRTLARLRNLSNNNGFVWTFTAVPAGSETRMGIDRNGNGIFDEDE